MGPIGLAAVYGARIAGASIIIGIDTNDKKAEVAEKIGCTHFVNPLKCKSESKNTAEVIKSLTNGVGLDYAIECVGSVATVEEMLKSVAPWGTIVNNGLAPGASTFAVSPNFFLSGIKLTGAVFGGYKSKSGIPKLVDEYVDGKIDVEDFFTGSIQLEAVDDAFKALQKGNVLRTVVIF